MTSATKTVNLLVALIAAAFLASACASTTEEPEEVPTGSEFSQGDVEPEPEPVATTRSLPLNLDPVYFDFDRAEIRDDARRVLQGHADSIKESDQTLTIEGHCDERGSEEYNLALGERRAASIKNYLTNLGVAGSQIRTISYGEAKPAVQGHDESAWRWNRRGAFRSS